MSRTDAHAPLWVRLARGELAVGAHHASDHASCDLPPRPPATRPSWLPNTKCYWSFSYTGTEICSCSMCHAGWECRRANRIERHRGRIALHNAVKNWRHGDEFAFDDLTPPTCARFW